MGSFSYVRRAFIEVRDEKERQRLLQVRLTAMREATTTLISDTGATIEVGVLPNQGVRYRSGQLLSEADKRDIWHRISGSPNMRNFSWLSMDISDVGPNAVLRMCLFREADIRDMASDLRISAAQATGRIDREAMGVKTLFAMYGETHVVVVGHLGTFENGKDGLTGLEALTESFRFE